MSLTQVLTQIENGLEARMPKPLKTHNLMVVGVGFQPLTFGL